MRQTVGWPARVPFVRPNFAQKVQALDFVIKNDYPARGEQLLEQPLA